VFFAMGLHRGRDAGRTHPRKGWRANGALFQRLIRNHDGEHGRIKNLRADRVPASRVGEKQPACPSILGVMRNCAGNMRVWSGCSRWSFLRTGIP
jgi:hypothetical protein